MSMTSGSINAKNSINPYNNKNVLLSKNDVQNLLKKYGIFQNINNLSYYQEAMTHPSYSIPYIKEVIERDNVVLVSPQDGCPPLQHKSYETLEFLGDAVIELVITNYLFRRYPRESEGFLSRMRVSLVNRVALAHLCRILKLSKFMLLSKTMDTKEDARIKEAYLEDIFEAFIGAIFLDFNKDKHGAMASFHSGMGFQIAEKFLIAVLEDEKTEIDITDLILDDGNYKGKIVKYFKKIYKTSITFKTINMDGTSGDREYIVYLYRDDTKEKVSEGTGKDNKQAQHSAAKNALVKLGFMSE
jgi:ribonuclease III